MKTPNYTNRLRQQRVRSGLKQIELSAKSGVGIATLTRLECWPVRVGLETALKITVALGCEVAKVFPYHSTAARKLEGI